MLSYQHVYHAGNAADVAKHAVWSLLLTHLTQKPKGLMVYETHAGRGLYTLTEPEAEKTQEYKDGVQRLLKANPQAKVLQPYLSQLKAHAPSYPASPALALALTRPQDEIHLAEAHPQEVKHLRQFAKGHARVRIHHADGHTAIPALLPSPTGRAVVLIDPSYEQKQEYAQVLSTVQAILQSAPKTVIMVWFPLLATPRHTALQESLISLGISGTHVSHFLYAPQHPGMQGCGHIILNLPYGLEDTITEALHALHPILAQASGGPQPLSSLEIPHL